MHIYELTRIHDDPRFGEFEFLEDAPSLLGRDSLADDFEPENSGRFDWTPVSLSTVWVPQQVVGGVQSYNDYPRVGGVPAFSRRAVAALSPRCERNWKRTVSFCRFIPRSASTSSTTFSPSRWHWMSQNPKSCFRQRRPVSRPHSWSSDLNLIWRSSRGSRSFVSANTPPSFWCQKTSNAKQNRLN